MRQRSGAVLEAPALVAGLHDVAVMGEAIEQRRGHLGIAEHARPFAAPSVARSPNLSPRSPRMELSFLSGSICARTARAASLRSRWRYRNHDIVGDSSAMIYRSDNSIGMRYNDISCDQQCIPSCSPKVGGRQGGARRSPRAASVRRPARQMPGPGRHSPRAHRPARRRRPHGQDRRRLPSHEPLIGAPFPVPVPHLSTARGNGNGNARPRSGIPFIHPTEAAHGLHRMGRAARYQIKWIFSNIMANNKL